ncbi:hypothetical protein [Curtobacterium sp. Leaf261]|uniref:hypothetical protein n=1 Tax=Curtobacterium sp. Leaf261 TaxID=1736311 RepID=UPI000A7E5918|nr:hypothetical protein [Curtobacterium sp. Leaf261]
MLLRVVVDISWIRSTGYPAGLRQDESMPLLTRPADRALTVEQARAEKVVFAQ